MGADNTVVRFTVRTRHPGIVPFLAALMILFALAVGVMPAAQAHPNHASTIEVESVDEGVAIVVTIPTVALVEATGLTLDTPLDAEEVESLRGSVLASLSVSGRDSSGWSVTVTDVSTLTRAGNDNVVLRLVAVPTDGETAGAVRLEYGFLVDRIPAHRVVVASGGEVVGTIDTAHRSLDVPIVAPTVDAGMASPQLELEAAGVPGAIGDAVLGTGRGAVWVAVFAAMGLGAAHAFAPGHGKTLTAAYLVGSRGTKGHAVLLGLTTAVSHTVGVALLGLVTLVAAETFDSALVYSALGAVSGLAITGIGVVMLWRSVRRRLSGHSHGPDHHDHDHDHDHHHAVGPMRWGSLAGLGLAGGMVPSASAVVLLLVAVRFGRPELGLLLVALFGVGMSMVLVGSGLLVLGAEGAMRDLADRRWGSDGLRRLSAVGMPIAAAVVTVVGVVWTVQAVV